MRSPLAAAPRTEKLPLVKSCGTVVTDVFLRLSFFWSGRLVARNAARARARFQGLRSEERMDERPVDNFRPTRPSFQCTQKG